MVNTKHMHWALCPTRCPNLRGFGFWWDTGLRIDNSGRSVNYTIDHNLETMLVTIACDIPNKRWYFCLSFHIRVIVNKFDLIFL